MSKETQQEQLRMWILIKVETEVESKISNKIRETKTLVSVTKRVSSPFASYLPYRVTDR